MKNQNQTSKEFNELNDNISKMPIFNQLIMFSYLLGFLSNDMETLKKAYNFAKRRKFK